MPSDEDEIIVCENAGTKNKVICGILKGVTAPLSYISSISNVLKRRESISKAFPQSQSVNVSKNGKFVYRGADFKEKLVDSLPDVSTIQELFIKVGKEYDGMQCHGTRRILSEFKDKDARGKEIKKLSLGEFEWQNYHEIFLKSKYIATFLNYMGFNSHHRISIFADTCSEWMCFFAALTYLNIQCVTVYSTLDDEAVVHALNITEVCAIFVDEKSCIRIQKLLPQIKSLKHIILSSSCTKDCYIDLPKNVKPPVVEFLPTKYSQFNKSDNYGSIRKASKILRKSVMVSSFDDETTEKCCDYFEEKNCAPATLRATSSVTNSRSHVKQPLTGKETSGADEITSDSKRKSESHENSNLEKEQFNNEECFKTVTTTESQTPMKSDTADLNKLQQTIDKINPPTFDVSAEKQDDAVKGETISCENSLNNVSKDSEATKLDSALIGENNTSVVKCQTDQKIAHGKDDSDVDENTNKTSSNDTAATAADKVEYSGGDFVQTDDPVLRNYISGDYETICHHLTFFVKHGRKIDKIKPFNFVSVSKDDIAVIMFTSGSTGVPKGVILQHKNIIAAVAGASSLPGMWKETVVYSSFLPLAHIYEIMMELTIMCQGGAIGYCRPLTLTDNSPMVAQGTKGDLRALRPTACAFVPIILERVRKGIVDGALKKGNTFAAILEYGLNHKRNARNSGMAKTPAVDKLVFSKVKDLVGGKLIWGTSGGAPLSEKTEEFMNIALGVPIKNGYGLTETCAAGFCGFMTDNSVGNCGPPVPCVEIQLVAWEEGGYSPNDKPNPRGEIWIHGPSVAYGYFKQEELTNETFVTDPEDQKRWFKTGDIAEYLPNGTFKIIDRKKDIAKLCHGEYISLVQIETVVVQSPFVEMVCALPNSESEHIVLFCTPNVLSIKEEAKKQNINLSDDIGVNELISTADIDSFIKTDILHLCEKHKFGKFQIPKAIHFVADLWTPDSGLLTPTMKVKRAVFKEFYKELLN